MTSQAAIEDIPQPEALPSEDRLLEVDDLESYVSQLDPFLAFHGYKPSEYRDWLKINAREVELQLLECRIASREQDSQVKFGLTIDWSAVRAKILKYMQAGEEAQLTSRIRGMPSMRGQFQLYDCGIFYKTMVVSSAD